MNFLVPLVMFGWIPAILYIFIRFPAQRAVVTCFIVAWLFLPQAEYPIIGLPNYNKMSATCYGILFATIIYDIGRFRSFKFGWVDIPMLIWCLCPWASSLTNGLGPYDGFSQSLATTMTWGIPYFLGRIYLNNLAGIRLLAIGIFVGGLIYIPLCLYEIRMSPQLHIMVYGYFPHQFSQAARLGGWRPQVFMQHGLELGMWMMAATLIGICLWKANVIQQIKGIPISWLVITLLITFIQVKSTGAYVLLALGIIILFIAWQFRTAIPILLLIVGMILYLGQNSLTETYFTDQLVHTLQNLGFPEDRVASLEYRFNQEELLIDKARQSLVFGWGGWGRNGVYQYDWTGRRVNVSITDSLWIITIGVNGLVGLSSQFLSFFLPIIAFLRKYPANLWLNRQVAPTAVIAVILPLYMLDCLVNAMINPIFILACGGIAGIALKKPEKNQVFSKLKKINSYNHSRLSLPPESSS